MFIDLKLLEKVYGISSDNILELIIKQHALSTQEVIDRFEISKQRLVGLKNQGYLKEVKKGIFLREEVELLRKKQAEEGRLEKFNKYQLMPAFKTLDTGDTIINKLRFFDCLTMVRTDSKDQNYNLHLKDAFSAIVKTFENDKKIYFTKHKGFDEVSTFQELEKSGIIIPDADYNLKRFYEEKFLEKTEAKILNMPKIISYQKTVEAVNQLYKLKYVGI
ncbi:hypothetical protein [Viridibacillus arvi]|uniref:hypothetical protein n=1 Tax=Viridibacillus arvi TaxID=263475 RepID=UPI0034CF0455